MILTAFYRAPRTFRMLPARPRYVTPPLCDVVERHILRGRAEHRGARHKVLRIDSQVLLRIGRPLCDGEVTGGLYELRELRVRNGRSVDPVTVYGDQVHRLRIGHVAVITTHPESPARNPHHAIGSRARREY